MQTAKMNDTYPTSAAARDKLLKIVGCKKKQTSQKAVSITYELSENVLTVSRTVNIWSFVACLKSEAQTVCTQDWGEPRRTQR